MLRMNHLNAGVVGNIGFLQIDNGTGLQIHFVVVE
ncbi:hypothetical protein PRJBM_00951 [Bartonella henselae]|nr:hypothetical protein Q654_00968 [Bartonella henselae JK 50]ETS08649.1 hypothetical protein Q655_00921 [Bartonella henselae JK 51]ETS11200.1 hypothetical protein Q653_00116 [Bartonella henselae JK 42]ETS15205.1 hypothetical protein Q652_00248 [Bartonella henselae JK 41]KEC57088.1 hypothetical protein O97_00906 [Bartonella henselae str. Zeus]KEC59676.1 hypothetical protein O95_00995 [Bartonella henselae JK 53]CDO40326.1 hypothetical protein PRJBM_00951 [Bartonella henselae]